ncbi:hypothetical protein [Microbispora sp. ATCC PTA-5024]|uniref:hypothetical protein n=1 Tax=Microbispora sp. ATCC PTA-5024 TaxID=316330 RepID=UPI0003DCA4BC|nr:hypothetical protein [Microbispora sp. ATCC PTA-5024]ETK32826.1 hypothetical protein MPTA5024_27760 [Microbispora sp. ATCC PTA-5024]
MIQAQAGIDLIGLLSASNTGGRLICQELRTETPGKPGSDAGRFIESLFQTTAPRSGSGGRIPPGRPPPSEKNRADLCAALVSDRRRDPTHCG